MHRLARMVLVFSICWFMAVSFISASALKIEPRQSSDRDMRRPREMLSIQTSTRHDSITVELVFPRPTICETLDYDSVEMQDLPRYGAPGEPILPFKMINVLIPQGKELQSIDVSGYNKRMLEGKFNLEYGRTPIPLSSNATVADQPNQIIYRSANPFPGELFSHVSEQHLRGYIVLLLTLHPVQYIPKTGELFYFETMAVTINLKETGKTSPLFRNLPRDRALVQSVVDNPNEAKTYTRTMTLMRPMTIVNSSESYDYVIITNNALNSSFQPLVNWKIQKGLNATIVLVEDILSDPDYFCNGTFGDGCGSQFNGSAARIRNFIKDAYLNWGTEYVLLGGDTKIIPKRGVYSFVATDPITVDRNIPCDMYYGALDGSWDNDNDTIFGEGVFDEGPENGTAGEEADFFAEVYIGRATVDTPGEARNFVNKTLWYEQASDDGYFKKALMVGETLDEETEGGNSKDLVTGIISQYTTTRLYDRDKTYSRSAVINAINSGTHILNHDGHTNIDIMMELDRTDVDTVISNTEYFLGYSVGCYAAAFDYDDSVVEHFIFNPQGAFAFIGNSRYGWYIPGTTYGPGDQFDRSFFSVLNNTAQNVGKTLQLSKENLFSSSMSSASRWTYFTLNLLGDPETEIVTDIMAPTAHFQTNPTAERLAPPVIKGLVNLTGTAKKGTAVGATFSNFTIEFGRGTSPGSWQFLGIELMNNGQNEIIDDTLATWNTSLVSRGIYTLKLSVSDVNGIIGEDRWIVRVEPLPAIRVVPQLTETQAGLTFTVSVRITDVENLYELDFQMSWNPTLLDYVSHTVYIPVEDYWWGVLHEPVGITKDGVNQTAGTYWIAAASSSPASPFNRDGTVFDMTFQAKTNGTCNLKIFSSNLTDPTGQPILHNVRSGTVEIAPGVHDVAVTNISTAGTVVGQGYPIKIDVTVANEGTFAESFNFTVYADETAFNTTQVLLSGDKSTTITITWDTTGVAKGNYTITVHVTPVPGETDTTDNTLTDGPITVTIPGDVDGDFDVDIYDIVKICTAYGSKKGDPKYAPNCDINGDGKINIYDVVIACTNYGKTDP